jgi:hypothetical protein
MNIATSPWTIYRKTSEAIEQKFSELWQQCYPRRYEEIGGSKYDSPKTVARAMMDAFLNYFMDKQPGQTEQNEALWAATMVKYGVPTYYLSHDIAVALTQTTPTEVLDCMGIKLPFDAAAFMLPLGVLNHAEYGPIAFVAYSRNLGGTSLNCPHPVPATKYTMHSVTNSFSVFLRTVSGKTLHWTYDQGIRLVDLKNDEELEKLQQAYSHTSRLGYESQNFTPDDIAAMMRTIKFIFNVVLLITHKPELIEAARLLKRVNKGPGKPIEYWLPHVIGRTFKLRYEHHEGSGTHASPRGHWVSGFWREQPHGPKHSLRKTLWIEPFWRGGQI